MFNPAKHPTDATLLLLIDDEISGYRAFKIRRHLHHCSVCKLRTAKLKETSRDLARFNLATLAPQISSSPGLRALLKAQIDASAKASANSRRQRLLWAVSMPVFAVALALSCVALYLHAHAAHPADKEADVKILMVPDRHLTPGAVLPVGLTDLCEGPPEDNLDPEVSPSTEKRVYKEYGVDDAPTGAYQVDYLINPQLGGSDDIKNLWPEPYRSTEWNAHAKDALEIRLHQMVCRGEINLASAQRDIATDWIAAYKKYFHTSEPL